MRSKKSSEGDDNFDRFADKPAPAERPKPKFESPKPARLRMALGAYYRMQSMRIAVSNGLKGINRDYPSYSDKEMKLDEKTFVAPLDEQEDYFGKVIGDMVKDHPLAKWIVANVKGMAWNLTAQLIGLLGDVSLYPNVSHLWSYAGLRPDQRRTAGVKSDWHPDLKRLMYNICTSLLKAGGYYAGVYQHYREMYDDRAERFYRKLTGTLGADHEVSQRIQAEFALADRIASHNMAEEAKAEASKEQVAAHNRNQLAHQERDPSYEPQLQKAYSPKIKMMKWNKLQGATLDAAITLGFETEKRGYHELVEGVEFLADRLGMKSISRTREGREVAILATPAITPAHRHMRAMRKTEKIFLEHIFLEWTKVSGRPPTTPWVFGPGGHSSAGYILPPSGRDAVFSPAASISTRPAAVAS